MQRTKTLELTMLIVAAVLVFATLACGGSSSSTRQVANTPTPATIIHTVAAGETLAIIAARYGTTVEAIVAMNNIADPDKIEIGQKLTIPAPKGQVQPAATKPPAQSTPVPATDTPSLPTDTPQPPAQDAVCQCGNDTYNCGDFGTQASAQACFNYCRDRGSGDIHKLDQDNNGVACESLP